MIPLRNKILKTTIIISIINIILIPALLKNILNPNQIPKTTTIINIVKLSIVYYTNYRDLKLSLNITAFPIIAILPIATIINIVIIVVRIIIIIVRRTNPIPNLISISPFITNSIKIMKILILILITRSPIN